MRSKKGFTLIEMMVVIAIIAVLVAVVIPVISNSTDKAAAATNAANLRSVEGELVSMLLVDPAAFGTWKAAQEDEYNNQIGFETDAVQPVLEDLQEAVDNTQKLFDLAEKAAEKADIGTPSAWTKENIETSYNAEKATHSHTLACIAGCTVDWKRTIKTAYVNAKEDLEEAKTNLEQAKADSEQRVDDLNQGITNLYTYTSDENGYITLENGTKIKAPVAEAVNIDNVNVDKGTVMTIYLNQNTMTFTATYGGFNKTDFALVANNDE